MPHDLCMPLGGAEISCHISIFVQAQMLKVLPAMEFLCS